MVPTTVFTSGWICPLNVCSYQTEGEQLGRCISVGQVNESQSSRGDGGPEYTVQTASSLMTHQQRRGHSVGVDEASVGALQGKKRSVRSAQSRGFQVWHCGPLSDKIKTTASLLLFSFVLLLFSNYSPHNALGNVNRYNVAMESVCYACYIVSNSFSPVIFFLYLFTVSN